MGEWDDYLMKCGELLEMSKGFPGEFLGTADMYNRFLQAIADRIEKTRIVSESQIRTIEGAEQAFLPWYCERGRYVS